jgi:vanillate O-demethylase monooxygenase subunit
MAADFIRDCWYAVAHSDEVGEALLARTVLGEDIVLYRASSGQPVALTDRCPHRLLPLSKGRRCGDRVQCGYHGLTFDAGGACVHVPGQERIPPAARVRSWPLTERYGLVFLWAGNAASANAGLLPALPKWDTPGWGLSRGPRTHFASNYLAVLENLLDPAHTTFVHTRTIGGASAAEVVPHTEERGDEIIAWRWVENAEPVPLMARFGRFAGNVDRWQYYHLTPPAFSMVDFGAVDAGAARDEAGRDAGFRIFSSAFLTPETATTTHYFWFQLRNFLPDDAAVSAELVRLYAATFDEDREILELIQRIESETGETSQVNIASDAGGTRMRRAVARRLQAQAAPELSPG